MLWKYLDKRCLFGQVQLGTNFFSQQQPGRPAAPILMKPSVSTSELLSSLADGQLDDSDFASALDACRRDESALACWDTYQLIGDALRSPAHAAAPLKPDAQLAFVDRLNKRLAQEPRIRAQSAPVEAEPVALDHPPVVDLSHRHEAASNDGSFRWKLVAGVASLAAVSAIAWNASALLAPVSPPQLAQASSAQIVVSSPQGMMVRDARLEELLVAHKQFGAASALQESSGFLQTATFDTPQHAPAVNGR